MDRKAIAAAAIGIIGNGFLVPTILNMLNLSQGWILFTSAATILAIWKWGHQPRTTSFVTAAGALLLALLTVYYFRKPEAAVPIQQKQEPKHETAVDPHGLCFIAFRTPYKDGKVTIAIRAENRNKGFVNTQLLNWSSELDGYASPNVFMQREAGTLYPEQKVALFASDPIEVGPATEGEKLQGRVDFEVRYGPTPENTQLLRVKGRVILQFHNGKFWAYWIADPDSTPDCQDVAAQYD